MNRSPALFIPILLGFVMAPWATGQESGSQLQKELQAVTQRLGDHQYKLRYKLKPNETLTYDVEHLVKVKTTIDGVSQTQRSRSTSRKVWEVTEASEHSAVFTHAIEYLNMWSEAQGAVPVKYDSRKGETPPAEYEKVAKMVGKPLALVKVDTLGNIVDREDMVDKIDFGTAGLTVPLPQKEVSIGQTWAVSRDVPVRLDDGSFKAIKTRQRYRLESVESGVARISMKTQVLTPSITPRVESQLIQKMTNGEIRFDIDAGRLLSRKFEWDESVVGFNGAKSNMEYLGRITETYVADDRVARRK